jgi:ABC-2 type transport system permease protein
MLESLLRIIALTRKELLAVLKDPRSRMSLLVPAIIQGVVFGYAATYDLSHVPYAVLDQDRSAASHQLLAGLDGSGVFDRVADLHNQKDIGTYIDQRRALLVIQINQDFERQLQLGQAANVQVIADGRNSNTAATASGYVSAVVGAFNERWRRDHGLPPDVLSTSDLAWYNPNLETRWNIIPGLIGTLAMLQTLMLTAMSVAREREEGTLDQLLVTPFQPFEIMVGKALPSILVGISQAAGVFLVAQLWFDIPFAGSIFTLSVGIIMFLLAAVGIGLLLSAIAATLQQAMLSSLLFLLPFSLLSGFATPISNMPSGLQYLTAINPLKYGIDIARRVYLEGVGLPVLVDDLWPLAIISLVTLSAASWMFGHRVT